MRKLCFTKYLKLLLLSFFLFLSINSIHAFSVELSGKVLAPGKNTLRLYSPQWFEDKIITISKDGVYKYVFESKYPAKFVLYYGEGDEEISFGFYVFKKSRISINVNTESGDKNKFTSSGISKRSEAFDKIDEIFINSFLPPLRTGKNPDSVLNSYVAAIKKLENIGRDEYTEVATTTAKLFYMRVLQTPDRKPLYNIFEREEFKQLPLNNEKYLGFSSYNQLMLGHTIEKLQKDIRFRKSNDLYRPDFREMYQALEQERNALPEVIFKSCQSILFQVYQESLRESGVKNFYIAELEKFIQAHPDYHVINTMKQVYENVTRTLAGKQAPGFTLNDTSGNPFSLHLLKGKYILLDVWGSWCGPCRRANKEMVKLYDSLKNNPDIVFVSVAYDRDINAWKQAIKDDNLSWKQLLFTEEFLRLYQVNAFPTMFLISPEQKILLRKTKIGKQDLKEFLPNK